MRWLPRFKIDGRDYVLNEKDGELRNPDCDWDFIPLSEADLEFYKALSGEAG
jgi:hypothetical protein